ncbi:Galactose-binding-like domain superfamily [Sesbania bispinosa]|nr:Galactose-binding-like domain superfamily [Sesbania bispinosa]
MVRYRLPSLDLEGLGKGHAWVNGQSIGRYWPPMVADANGCNDTCDYRGNYGPERCVSGCREPSQRFYHVPRSFLNNDTNTLILFEEMGGNPSNVSVQTITVGSICATANYGSTLEVNFQGGKTISEIQFASYGDPQGKCGSFQKVSGNHVTAQQWLKGHALEKTHALLMLQVPHLE